MVLVDPSKPFCGMLMLSEAFAPGTTWPPKVKFNPRKVRAFGMRAGLPHATRNPSMFVGLRTVRCDKCLTINGWPLLLS